MKYKQSWSSKRTLRDIGIALFICMAISWIAYAVIGHYVIETLYRDGFLNQILGKQAPLETYFWGADAATQAVNTWVGSLSLVLLLSHALMNRPKALGLVCLLLFFSSLLIYTLLEFVPRWIVPLGLDQVAYYRTALYKIPDQAIGFRGRPRLDIVIDDSRRHNRAAYLAKYDVDVDYSAGTYSSPQDWRTDKNGFRRSDRPPSSSEILLLGDSFLEHGQHESDTFGRLLEQHLPGWTVANFGTSGFGPFQYLQVLKKHGIQRQPKFALFCFFEGNDVNGVKEYLRWKEDGTPFSSFPIGYRNFLERYPLALMSTVQYVRESTSTFLESIERKVRIGPVHLHPDLAVVHLPDGNDYKVFFVDKHDPMTTDDMLRSDEWQTLSTILREFKEVSLQHDIQPVILYIPMGASIYAEYSTDASGTNWRALRDRQVSSARNREQAMRTISEQLQIDLISLADVFRSSAKHGQMVYEPIDSHWNRQGREIAANHVAALLKMQFIPKYAPPLVSKAAVH